MEDNVFTDPAVAGILVPKFVESRLHLETFEAAGGEVWNAFEALRNRYAHGSRAMPTYAIVNPDDGAALGFYQLEGGPATWMPGIKRFLESALDPQ